jgi:Putative beta barrel porin-7 (BBP7)
MLSMNRRLTILSLIVAGLIGLVHERGWAQPPSATRGYFVQPGAVTLGPAGRGYQPPREIFEELPDDFGWGYANTPFEQLLKNAFRHGCIRVEYMNAQISTPGDRYIGSATNLFSAEGRNLSSLSTASTTLGPQRTVVQDFYNDKLYGFQSGRSPLLLAPRRNPISSATPQDVGVMAFNDFIELTSLNGVRGTYEMPLAQGSLEISAFTLEPSTSSYRFVPGQEVNVFSRANSADSVIIIPQQVVDTVDVLYTPVLFNGTVPRVPQPETDTDPGGDLTEVVTTTDTAEYRPTAPFVRAYLTYDVDYQAAYRTSVFGSEANFVLNEPNPNTPFSIRPMLGFRYFNFRESFLQAGHYNSRTGTGVTTVARREIYSEADNYVYGPQIGLRAEAKVGQFDFGVEPKAMVGLNQFKTQLNAININSPTDPAQRLVNRELTLSSVLDMKAYTRWHLNQLLSVYLAYNATFAPQVTRPGENIVYNITPVTLPTTGPNADFSGRTAQSAFQLKNDFTQILIQSVSVGAELNW